MEALACATPVLASSVDGTRNLIKNKNCGILFKAGNYKDIAAKIKMVLTNKNLGKNIRSYLKSKYDKSILDVSKRGIEVIKIYSGLMEKSK